MDSLKQTPSPLQLLATGSRLARHRHEARYAAVVLRGGYVEAGRGGRLRAGPGMVLVHDAYSAHMNFISDKGAAVLNLPLPATWRSLPRAFRIADPDRLVAALERDVAEALRLLVPLAAVAPLQDWPDELARRLEEADSLSLDHWASERGLAPASVSRGFRSAYGVSPRRYRAEARALAAIARLTHDQASIAEIAAEEGFADQSHMTRAVRALTTHPPARLRQVKSVQDGKAKLK